MVKNKYDPLTTIEAKNALYGCSKDSIFRFDDMMTKSAPNKGLPTIVEDREEEGTVERAMYLSPVRGSQGAPEVDLSSQEEMLNKESQDIDWDLIQEEYGQNSEVIEMEIDTAQQKEATCLSNTQILTATVTAEEDKSKSKGDDRMPVVNDMPGEHNP